MIIYQYYNFFTKIILLKNQVKIIYILYKKFVRNNI